MNRQITEKNLLKDFSAIEELIKKWEKLYPEYNLPEPSREEDGSPPIVEPIFTYQIHSSS